MTNTYTLLKGHPNCDESFPINEVVETYNFQQFMPVLMSVGGIRRELGIPVHVSNPEYVRDLQQSAGLSAPALLTQIKGTFASFGADWSEIPDPLAREFSRVQIEDVPSLAASGVLTHEGRSFPLRGLPGVMDDLQHGRTVSGTFIAKEGTSHALVLEPVVAATCALPDRISVDAREIREFVPGRTVLARGVGKVRLQISENERIRAIRDGYAKAAIEVSGVDHFKEVLIDVAARAPVPAVQRSALRAQFGDTPAVDMSTAASTHQIPQSVLEALNRRMVLHVPIEQDWKLSGYSRGTLANTFSLAPQEQLTIEVFTWDRSRRVAESSATYETESTIETSSMSKVTSDALREAKNTSGWTFGGDGSLTVPSIPFELGVNFSSSDSTEKLKRNTIQRISESTSKASTRIKSTLQTKVTVSAEFGREERTVRRIVNPNAGRILHIDCFEVLANYVVTTRYRFDRATLCVLYPCVDFLMSLDAPGTDTRSAALLALEGLIADLVPERLRGGFAAARTHLAWMRICSYVCDKACACEAPKADGSTAPAAAGNTYASPLESALQRLRPVIDALMKASGIPLSRRVGIPAETPGYLDSDSQTQATLRRDWQAYLYRQLVLEKMGSTFWNACQEFLSQPDNTPSWAERLVQSATAQVANVLNGAVAFATLGPQVAGFVAEQGVKFKLNLPFMVPYVGFDDLGLESAFQQTKAAYTSWAEAEAQRHENAADKEADPPAEPGPRRSTAQQFSAEALASASVEVDALTQYILLNKSLFRSTIWNALTPDDRLRFLGIFGDTSFATPRVLGFVGDFIAVEFERSRMPEAAAWIEETLASNEDASQSFEAALPISGITMQSRLEKCDSLEPYLTASRSIELRRDAAIASQLELEAKRMGARLDKGDLDSPVSQTPTLRLENVDVKP